MVCSLGGKKPIDPFSIDPNSLPSRHHPSGGLPGMENINQRSQAAQNGSLERVVSDMNSKKAGRFSRFGVAETTKC